tara:strand:- start:211 stop:390 length:180 start_codon:yes stop_codon:yes gene_type:complete
MKNKTSKALKKYGADKCAEAFRMYGEGRMGARTVGQNMNVTTMQADEMINAGREAINNT